MANLHPQITVITEAEAFDARAEVRPVPTPQVVSADQYKETDVSRTTTANLFSSEEEKKPKDYFIEKDGLRYAGSHLIVDMWNANRLDDEELIQSALRDAVTRAGATLLHIHTHKFTEGGGVSGVAVLAESHISVHTWPERSFAAFDIFMCGDAVPSKAIPALREAFGPCSVSVTEHKRGIF